MRVVAVRTRTESAARMSVRFPTILKQRLFFKLVNLAGLLLKMTGKQLAQGIISRGA